MKLIWYHNGAASFERNMHVWANCGAYSGVAFHGSPALQPWILVHLKRLRRELALRMMSPSCELQLIGRSWRLDWVGYPIIHDQAPLRYAFCLIRDPDQTSLFVYLKIYQKQSSFLTPRMRQILPCGNAGSGCRRNITTPRREQQR